MVDRISLNDKFLRQEIIESQKMQADFLKWKLITVAAVFPISLGLTSKHCNPTEDSTKLLICLIPLLCAYVDLICLHNLCRAITIGAFLKFSGNKYECFVFAVRKSQGTDPFVFERLALKVSSIVVNAIVFLLGIFNPPFYYYLLWPWLNPATLFGVLGIVVNWLLWSFYCNRVNGIIKSADLFRQCEDAE